MLHGHIRSEVIGAIQKEPSQYEIWVRVWGMEVRLVPPAAVNGAKHCLGGGNETLLH